MGNLKIFSLWHYGLLCLLALLIGFAAMGWFVYRDALGAIVFTKPIDVSQVIAEHALLEKTNAFFVARDESLQHASHIILRDPFAR